MIKINNVKNIFPNGKGIEEGNLEIKDKSRIAILGPNGVGKTTLLKIILGFIIPQEGEVYIDGISTKDKNFALKNVGYVYSGDIFYENLNVKQYINVMNEMSNNKYNNIEKIAKLLQLDLNDKTKIKKLSTGTKQKLKICLALSDKNDILIFDEPTSGLDPISRDNFLEYLKNDCQNKTILYSTHIVEEVEEICNELIFIKERKILLKNEYKDLLKEYKEVYA